MTYVARRLLLVLPVLLAVTVLSFALVKLLPGDPASTLLGIRGTEEARRELRRQLGLDRPLVVQYVTWLGDIVRGRFGESYLTRLPIRGTITRALPVTAEVVLLSQLLAVAVAVPTAVWSAARRGRAGDRLAGLVTFGLLAVPSYITGVILVYIFAVWLPWAPASGYVPFGRDPMGNLRDMALPAVTLALGSIPIYVRVLRAEMIIALQQDFILAARSRGVRRRRVLVTHALRPALPGFVTVLGIHVGGLIGGAVVVEYIFGLPGLGTVFLNAILGRDYLLVQACVVVFTVGYVLLNLAVDLLHPVVDARTRRAGPER